ncbi:MAG: hypothetical protein NDI82_07850, partial [Anaeromyxobacteraceae bacterium]|nr:hypothetical protein [Anaeromyxobacteraceae bacterium]
FSADITLTSVILASNNFSPAGVETAIRERRLHNLYNGAGNTLRGLAGEAEYINRQMAAAGFVGAVAFPGPKTLLGESLGDIVPDVGVVATGSLHLMGTITGPDMPPTSRFMPRLRGLLVEVKSGLSKSSIYTGVRQVEAYAAAIQAVTRLQGVVAPVLVVDAQLWYDVLDARQRETIFDRVQKAGGYIAPIPGLADAAAVRAEDYRKQVEQVIRASDAAK